MFLKAISFFILIFFPSLSYAKDDAGALTAKANRLYKEGKYDEALSLYNRALIAKPDSALLNFNIGAANYKKGDYEKASGYFEKSALTEDRLLEYRANYNSGNSRYKSAKLKEATDMESAVTLMRQSLEHYKRAMELNNKDEDAKINHDIVEKELKALLEKLKNQPQSSSKDKEKDKDNAESRGKESQKASEGQPKEDKAESRQPQVENKEAQSEDKGSQGIREANKKEGQREDNLQAFKSSEEKAREMSEQEARMLLEGQRQDENLGGQIRDTEKGETEEVEKDW